MSDISTKKHPLDNYGALSFKAATADELKAIGDDLPEGYVAGWASTPTIDSYSDVVRTGAFDQSIAERGLSGVKGIKFLLDHDMRQMAGVIKRLETRSGGLWMEAQLNLEIAAVRDKYSAAKMNAGIAFSVGFRVQDYEYLEDALGAEYRAIKRGDLIEVSLVTLGANEDCGTVFLKSGDEAEMEQVVYDEKSLAVVPKTVAEFEYAIIAAGFAKTRVRAKKMSTFVKLSAALFAAKEKAPPLDTPVVPLDSAKFGSASNLIKQMKSTLARAAN